MSFDQNGARALITAIGSGPLTDARPLVLRNGVEPVLALFAAGQDPGGMELAGSTTAVGFAALAPEQVAGSLHHRVGALEPAQRGREGGIGSPKLLARAGQVVAKSASNIY